MIICGLQKVDDNALLNFYIVVTVGLNCVLVTYWLLLSSVYLLDMKLNKKRSVEAFDKLFYIMNLWR